MVTEVVTMLRVVVFITALALPAVSAAQQPCISDARRVVNELYRTMLERSADRNSDALVQRLATGDATVRDIVRDMVSSAEYQRRFMQSGDSDAARRETVTALYRHLLGRQPDPGGLQAHMEGLRTQGAAAVIDSMLTSEEYRQRFGEQGVPGTQVRYCEARFDTSNRARTRLRTLDTNRDGQITGDEWRGSLRAFSDIDVNGDGVLTQDELRGPGANRAVGTSGTVDEDSAARFDALDRNRNGRLERNEWPGTAAEFDRLDTNGNNLLSRAEAAGAFAAASREFDSLDRNRDGRLTIQEWNWNRRSFDQQDTDGDGVITAREFRGRPGNRTGF